MEVLGAGLDHHEDGSTRADAVVGSVVAVESLELGERIERGQGAEAAAATAIVQFAAIQSCRCCGSRGSH